MQKERSRRRKRCLSLISDDPLQQDRGSFYEGGLDESNNTDFRVSYTLKIQVFLKKLLSLKRTLVSAATEESTRWVSELTFLFPKVLRED